MLSLVEARYPEYRCQYRERFHTFWHVHRSIPSFVQICPHDHWAFSRSIMTWKRSSRVVSVCHLPIGCSSRVLLTFILDFFQSCGFLIVGGMLAVKSAVGHWLLLGNTPCLRCRHTCATAPDLPLYPSTIIVDWIYFLRFMLAFVSWIFIQGIGTILRRHGQPEHNISSWGGRAGCSLLNPLSWRANPSK